MSPNDVVVAGFGATTAVGLTPGELDTSVRSSSARFEETPYYDHRYHPFVAARPPEAALPELAPGIDGIEGLTTRERRLIRLAAAALDQCGPLTDALPFAPALWLALPEHATAIPIDAKRLVEAITVQTRVRIDRNAMNAASRGRAGGLMAIGAAATSLREGKVGAALVCGADTFIDAFVLGTMDLEQRVKTNANLDGFVPGEGAGVVLLLTRAVAAQLGIAPVATIAAAGNGAEKGHLYSTEPYRGEGLATTLQMLFASAGTLPPITSVFSSMNGESHWGQEWGVSVVRNSAAIDPNVLMHHPADCYGDVGAAAGPLLTTLASLALRGGRSASPTLVYASSDYGDRSALILVGN